MDKVRFACPRCQTIMQSGAEKIGYDVACPHCTHRFRLVESEKPAKKDVAAEDTSDGGKELESTIDRPAINVPNKTASAATATVLDPVVAPPAPVGFQCPYCRTTQAPTAKSEVSQLGWILFVVLLLMTCFGCVIGLLVRDHYQQCSHCKIRLG